MREEAPSPPHLLVVEADLLARRALLRLLEQDGYTATGVASLEEALIAVDAAPFDLLLADLHVGRSRHSFTPAHLLRRHALPTPLAILTQEAFSLWDKRWEAFAFVLAKPVEGGKLLAEVAACLKHPWSQEQIRQGEVLRRFVAAVRDQAWNRLLGMCTEDVIYYPSAALPWFSVRPLRGLLALRAYAASVWQGVPHLRLEVHEIASRPKGLALRYVSYVATPEGGWTWYANTEVFQFVGERISQIGLPPLAGQAVEGRNQAPGVG